MKEYLRIALAVIAFCVCLYFTHFILASAVCAIAAHRSTKPDPEPETEGGENGGKES